MFPVTRNFRTAAVAVLTFSACAMSAQAAPDAAPGALAGRSPQKIYRPAGATPACGKAMHSLPAGKTPSFGAHAAAGPSCASAPTLIAGADQPSRSARD